MKSPALLTMSLFLLLAVILTACNMPATGTKAPTIEVIPTEASPTSQVVPTDTQPGQLPTEIATHVPPTATATTPPTATSTPEPTATTPATPTAIACTNLAKFVDDVTVPDDTEMIGGQEFTKTWRLQNVGSCTWTDKYSLVFVTGDQMGGTSPTPLAGSTAPNATVDVSVKLVAPSLAGSYRSDWELSDPSGAKFGTGTNANESFYAKIKVVEGVADLNLGPATWTDNLDNTNYWYMLDTANTKWTQGDGKLIMKSINPGAGEEWGLSNEPGMKDYYLQATFITGSECSGRDKYGLLARAPEENKGYVFEFSCDGEYRLYTWDGKNYTALQEWTSSASIKEGASQTNTMGIWMKGNTIKLYANNHKLLELTDSTFNQGQFGLVIGSVVTTNFTVYVDQVAYWDFDQ